MAAYGEAAYGESAFGEAPPTTITATVALAVALAVGFTPLPDGDVFTAPMPLGRAVATAPNPAVTQEAIVSTTAGRAVAVGFPPTLSGVSLTVSLARAKAATLTPAPNEVIAGGTDSSNAGDGRSRDGISAGSTTYPVEPVPVGLTLGQRVDKAIAYPNPVMVNGRPT